MSGSELIQQIAYEMWDPWKKLIHVLNEVLAHSVGAVCIVLILFAIDLGAKHLPQINQLVWLVDTPYMFTVHDLVHWADLGTIAAFLAIGFIRIVRGMLS